jgi:hypothetical protein
VRGVYILKSVTRNDATSGGSGSSADRSPRPLVCGDIVSIASFTAAVGAREQSFSTVAVFRVLTI